MPSTPSEEILSSPKQQYLSPPSTRGEENMSSSNLPSSNASAFSLPSLNASVLDYSDASTSVTSYFRSRRRARKDDILRPSTTDVQLKFRIWYWLLPLFGAVFGIGVAGFQVYLKASPYFGLSFCPVLMEEFSSPTLNPAIWTHEIQVGGFG